MRTLVIISMLLPAVANAADESSTSVDFHAETLLFRGTQWSKFFPEDSALSARFSADMDTSITVDMTGENVLDWPEGEIESSWNDIKRGGVATLIADAEIDPAGFVHEAVHAHGGTRERRPARPVPAGDAVDGLAAEREQGITIDVAYRYFSTAKRKFIIADTPGHEQYTRNMATGASTCDLAIILIDARYGVQTQTKRHSFIASLLGIKHVVVAVNKMDLLDFSEDRFNEIQKDYLEFAEKLNISDIRFVPMSALDGDNVVDRSTRCDWYTGMTLMEILESVEVSEDKNVDTSVCQCST